MFKTSTVHMQGGCFECHGDTPVWTAKNARGLAAQHAQRTGHRVWVSSTVVTSYAPTFGETKKLQKRAERAAGFS